MTTSNKNSMEGIMKKRIIAIVAIIALVAMLGLVLVACNADSYKSKLEKAGYTVVVLEGDEAEAEEEGVEWIVTASKAGDGLLGAIDREYVTVVKYANSADAKEAEQAAIDLAGEKNVHRVGTIVITGTEQGVKDAK